MASGPVYLNETWSQKLKEPSNQSTTSFAPPPRAVADDESCNFIPCTKNLLFPLFPQVVTGLPSYFVKDMLVATKSEVTGPRGHEPSTIDPNVQVGAGGRC